MFFFKKIFLMMYNDENPRSEGEKIIKDIRIEIDIEI